MAEPQTENGFVMIALDLFTSIMVADLPNRCMIVLSYHLVHSYGPAKKRDVFLDPASIEDCTKLHRNNVRRAIKELCEANILEKRPGAAYRFNKDYESWAPGGVAFGRRLNGGTLEFAAWTLNAHGKRIKKSKADAIQADSPPIPLDSVTVVEPNPAGFRDSCRTQSDGIATITDPINTGVVTTDGISTTCDEPLVYAGVCPHKSIRFEIEDSKQQQEGSGEADDGRSFPIQESLPRPEAPPAPSEAAPALVVEPEPEAAPPPPLAIARPKPAAARPGPPARPPAIKAPDPATVLELEEFALASLGDRGELESFRMHIRGWLFSFAAVHIRDAIMGTAANARDIRPGKLAAYAVKILQEPPRRTAEAAEDRHRPMTPEDVEIIEASYEAARIRAEEDAARRSRRAAR